MARNASRFASLMILVLLTGSCTFASSWMSPVGNRDLPPILSQDEIIRPFNKLGRIKVTREVFVTDYAVTPEIRAWGYQAIREEAAKMEADAVILPEVTGRTITSLITTSTEYLATGVAIKFK